MWSRYGMKDWKFVQGHVKFKMFVGHSGGEIEDAVEYVSLKFRKEVQSGDQYWDVISE